MADSYFSMESKIASLSSRSVHTAIYTYFKISPLKFQEETIRERGKKNGRNFFFVFLLFCQTATVHTGITTNHVIVFMWIHFLSCHLASAEWGVGIRSMEWVNLGHQPYQKIAVRYDRTGVCTIRTLIKNDQTDLRTGTEA